MFRAIPCSSSAGQIVLLQHLVSSLSVSSYSVHRLRADLSPLSTGALNSYSHLSPLSTCALNSCLPYVLTAEAVNEGKVLVVKLQYTTGVT